MYLVDALVNGEKNRIDRVKVATSMSLYNIVRVSPFKYNRVFALNTNYWIRILEGVFASYTCTCHVKSPLHGSLYFAEWCVVLFKGYLDRSRYVILLVLELARLPRLIWMQAITLSQLTLVQKEKASMDITLNHVRCSAYFSLPIRTIMLALYMY